MVIRSRLSAETKDEIRKRYIAGDSCNSISDILDISFSTVRKFVEKNKLGRFREEAVKQTNTLMVADVADMKAKATIEILDPMIVLLNKHAETLLTDNIDELSGKDIMNSLEALLRLRSKLKGENIQKHHHSDSSMAFKAIIEEARLLKASGAVIECRQWDLLE